MTITFTSPTLSHSSRLGGAQDAPKVIDLPSGGFVVAWQDTLTATRQVLFQRHDGAGVAQGGPVLAFGSTDQITLTDILLTDDGRIMLAATDDAGSTLIRSFTGAGVAVSAALNIRSTVASGVITGAQIVQNADDPGTATLWTSVFSAGSGTLIERTLVTTAGTVTTGPSVIAGGTTEFAVVELLEGDIGLLTPGQGLLGPGAQGVSGDEAATDAITLQDGMIVTVEAGGFTSPTLRAVQGASGQFADSTVSDAVTLNSIPGTGTAGAGVFDQELVDLGNGRIMVLWVADAGDSQPNIAPFARDGVYAAVYDVNRGAQTEPTTLLLDFGSGSNDALLAQLRLSASVLADGRVVLALSQPRGLTGLDVQHMILDARNAGIIVTGRATADTFAGTGFDDQFLAIGAGDVVAGGAGSDTVSFSGSFSGNAGVQIDLASPAVFASTAIRLTDVENLTGTSGDDSFNGSALANLLAGGAGNDVLAGRAGNDSLLGDAGNDAARGAAGNDLLLGGTASDSLFGGAGDDVLDGETGNDLLHGGADADHLTGGSGNDTLHGQDGEDDLSGGIGDDLLDGGAGADILTGGEGNDTLRADEGADSVAGGAGNDVITADTEADIIDGGAGIDTLILSTDLSDITEPGLQADLANTTDLLGLPDTFIRFAATITGVENLTGTAGRDFLAGDGAANVINGGAGDDVILGRSGADTLFGGFGADTFVLTDPTGGSDQIRDFADGVDQIGLLASAFGDLAAADLATRLSINSTGSIAANGLAQLAFDNAGAGIGRLFFDADGNGAGAAVLIATLTFAPTGGIASFDAGDFTFL